VYGDEGRPEDQLQDYDLHYAGRVPVRPEDERGVLDSPQVMLTLRTESSGVWSGGMWLVTFLVV